MPGTGSEVNRRGLVTQTGPEAELLPGRGQAFGISGPVEATCLEASAVIGPQVWAGMVAEPPVGLTLVLEVWAGLVTEPDVELVIDTQAVTVPLLPQPQLDHRGHP